MTTALLRGRTSLVVDDDDGVRSTLRELLVAMHADVHVAVMGSTVSSSWNTASRI